MVDEFSFLTGYALRDFESAVSQLAQKGRPTGIHMVLSTKELTSKNVTGIIKACIPARIALSTQTANESRTIMDGCDAECLLLKGDLLLCNSIIHKPRRIQAPYLPENKIIEFMKRQ